MKKILLSTILLICFIVFVNAHSKVSKKSNRNKSIVSKNCLTIDSIYIPGNFDTIFYNTKCKNKNILLADPDYCYRILSKTPNNEWVLLSIMPSDPEQAHGTNEIEELYYVPLKKIL